MRTCEIFNDLYLWDIFFIDSDSPDEVLKAYGVEFNGIASAGFHNKKFYMIINTKSKVFDVEAIVHESGHIASMIFIQCGIKMELDNDEPYQYLLQWIFRHANMFFKKSKR